MIETYSFHYVYKTSIDLSNSFIHVHLQFFMLGRDFWQGGFNLTNSGEYFGIYQYFTMICFFQ